MYSQQDSGSNEGYAAAVESRSLLLRFAHNLWRLLQGTYPYMGARHGHANNIRQPNTLSSYAALIMQAWWCITDGAALQMSATVMKWSHWCRAESVQMPLQNWW